MDLKDIKGFLYGWLGKQKIGAPQYTINAVTRGGTQRFKCELRVPGHNYVGLGNSLNKKVRVSYPSCLFKNGFQDAGTNAALDFCNYLVRQGLLKSSDIPALEASSLQATTVTTADDSNRGSFFMAGGSEEAKCEEKYAGGGSAGWKRAPPSAHDQYVTQKAEEIAQSESVDLKAEIHGGWTMDNSKKALNEFLQKLRLPPIGYNTQLKEANNCRTYVAEASIYLPSLRKLKNYFVVEIFGRGQGSSKKVAEAGCSTTIVRQLFHLRMLSEFKGERKKSAVTMVRARYCISGFDDNSSYFKLPEIPILIPPSLAERVKKHVLNSGVTPVSFTEEDNPTQERPKSLLTNCKLDQFPDSKAAPPGNISWAPPMQNWNAWRASNIDEPPLAFMSLPEISAKLRGLEESKAVNASMAACREKLPVLQFRDEILNTVAANRVTLIKGETGCGKSTQVVQYLQDSFIWSGHGAEFNAFVSQPRRISAISLAERVASERGEELGESIGYGVRFDSISPRPYGAVMFCTVGVLLRKMESGLRGISHIIIDEIHERDVNTDFILIVLREMLREYADLRVILMSATIDTKMFIEFFGGVCPVIEMKGRTFPVQHFFLEDILRMLRYMPPPPEKRRKEDADLEVDEKDKNLNILTGDVSPELKVAMANLSEKEIPLGVIEAILTDIATRGEAGSVLVFLPGWNEIMLVMNFLNNHPEFCYRVYFLANQSKYVILPLHSQLTGAEQRKVFDHYGDRMRKYISIFGETHRLEQHRTAEILRTPLHEVALTIKLLRLGSVGDFLEKALEAPPYDMIVESETMLQSIGALDRHLELTSLGQILARLPIEPMIGRTIVMGVALGIGSLLCDIAAASSFSSPFVPRERSHTRLSSSQRAYAGDRWSDHIALHCLNSHYCLHFITLNIRGAKRQLIDVLTNQCGFEGELFTDWMSASESDYDLLLSLLIAAYYPNICYYRGKRKVLVFFFYIFTNFVMHFYLSKVYTLEQASALVSKSSVLTPFQGDNFELPSPLIVFSEKVGPTFLNRDFFLLLLLAPLQGLRTRVISCKQLSVISGVQLLLFGCRKIECVGKDLIRMDDMITLKMDVSVAASIVALRPCIEAMLVRSCLNPESLMAASEQDRELCSLLRELSSRRFYASGGPMKDDLLTDAALDPNYDFHSQYAKITAAFNALKTL
uniref:RNA helicase n=1 Tax=Angiostrongylus cantonensis TaxID=6313 RepID=A0A158P5Q9_ANGCA